MHKNELLAVLFGPVGEEKLEGKLECRHGLSSKSIQHAKKVMSDNLWLVDSILGLPVGQVKFSEKIFQEIQITEKYCNFGGASEIDFQARTPQTCSYSLPNGQARTLVFFEDEK